jgi:hypothetical protein
MRNKHFATCLAYIPDETPLRSSSFPSAIDLQLWTRILHSDSLLHYCITRIDLLRNEIVFTTSTED